MSEHEHTEPEPDERRDEPSDVEDAPDAPEPDAEDEDAPAALGKARRPER
jgi:hypothetical protein